MEDSAKYTPSTHCGTPCLQSGGARGCSREVKVLYRKELRQPGDVVLRERPAVEAPLPDLIPQAGHLHHQGVVAAPVGGHAPLLHACTGAAHPLHLQQALAQTQACTGNCRARCTNTSAARVLVFREAVPPATLGCATMSTAQVQHKRSRCRNMWCTASGQTALCWLPKTPQRVSHASW